VNQLVKAGYLDVQRTGRTNGYRVENPARKRAVDQAAKALLDTVTAPELSEEPPLSTAAKEPPEWFKETPSATAETKAPAAKEEGLPYAFLEALRGSLKDDRRTVIDLNTSTSKSALRTLMAAGYSAGQIAANLNEADLTTARNAGGVLASRLKSLADSGMAPPKPKPAQEAKKPALPPVQQAIVQWGFRDQLAPMTAELEKWEKAGGSVLLNWSHERLELLNSDGRTVYTIEQKQVGEVEVQPADRLKRLTQNLRGVIADIADMQPVKVSELERWKAEREKNPVHVDNAYLEVKAAFVAGEVARGVHPDQAEALFNLTWQGDTSDKAAEIAAEIAAALKPEGTAADIAAREVLADVVLAGAEPLENMVLKLAEGMRL
jgi:hypothetical protein